MNLYLLRHGEAEPRQYDDPTRSLTELGTRDVKSVARQFATRGITLDLCLHSPYLRTTQTASTFLAELNCKVNARAESMLTPDHRALPVLQTLRALTEQNVLLVTHNPLVSEMLAVLTDTDLQSMHIVGTSELNALHCVDLSQGGGQPQFRLQARRQ
jgi:phosphohistidine phosphatase